MIRVYQNLVTESVYNMTGNREIKNEKREIKMKEKYKIVFGIVLILILIPLPVVADLGDIVASFNTPPGGVIYLDWDGEDLWCYGMVKIYEMDTSGNIVTTFDYPHILKKRLTGGVPDPLTYDGKYYYMVFNNFTRDPHRYGIIHRTWDFYKLDKKGNIIASSKHVEDVRELSAITYDGKYIWGIADHKLYKFDTNGNLISSFGIGLDATYSLGLAWDGEYLWCTAPQEKRIYKLDTNGNVITSIDAPGKLHYITGLTCDGKYLWCASGDETENKIYKIDLGKAALPSKPSEEKSSQPLKPPETGTPGFETIFALAGLLAVAYLLRRKR
jgi:PGF-CTERM protein